MVDTKKLKARMVLEGFSQERLAKAAGMSKNALNSKINGRTPFNCDEADVICEILKIEAADEKVEIFLA